MYSRSVCRWRRSIIVTALLVFLEAVSGTRMPITTVTLILHIHRLANIVRLVWTEVEEPGVQRQRFVIAWLWSKPISTLEFGQVNAYLQEPVTRSLNGAL